MKATRFRQVILLYASILLFLGQLQQKEKLLLKNI
nr:MAG TPA: hypothetical protein [Caudoviricetes sp.]